MPVAVEAAFGHLLMTGLAELGPGLQLAAAGCQDPAVQIGLALICLMILPDSVEHQHLRGFARVAGELPRPFASAEEEGQQPLWQVPTASRSCYTILAVSGLPCSTCTTFKAANVCLYTQSEQDLCSDAL